MADKNTEPVPIEKLPQYNELGAEVKFVRGKITMVKSPTEKSGTNDKLKNEQNPEGKWTSYRQFIVIEDATGSIGAWCSTFKKEFVISESQKGYMVNIKDAEVESYTKDGEKKYSLGGFNMKAYVDSTAPQGTLPLGTSGSFQSDSQREPSIEGQTLVKATARVVSMALAGGYLKEGETISDFTGIVFDTLVDKLDGYKALKLGQTAIPVAPTATPDAAKEDDVGINPDDIPY